VVQVVKEDADCGCDMPAVETTVQRRILTLALVLNTLMFVIGLIAGILAQSSGLIADSLDMLADACAYAIALMAVRRSRDFKARASLLSGNILLILGVGVLLDVARRGWFGTSPDGLTMLMVAALALVVNSSVLYLLRRYREGEVHLRTTWLFTRVDVVANLAVITSGFLVYLTNLSAIDLVVGAAIGMYVVKEAWEIVENARRVRAKAAVF
jgi:cation diffusion facilitator family transporter